MADVLLREPPSRGRADADFLAQTPRPYPPSDPLPELDTSVHPGAVMIPLSTFAWFILAIWIGFGEPKTSLALAAVTFLGIMYFGLLVGAARFARRTRSRPARQRSFREFLDGDVEMSTERITGRSALVQIAIMPITLVIGGTCIIAAAVSARLLS
jgi:hypothetical protein